MGERCSLPHSASLAASILELSVPGVLEKEEDQKIPVRRKDIKENVTSAGISGTKLSPLLALEEVSESFQPGGENLLVVLGASG